MNDTEVMIKATKFCSQHLILRETLKMDCGKVIRSMFVGAKVSMSINFMDGSDVVPLYSA